MDARLSWLGWISVLAVFALPRTEAGSTERVGEALAAVEREVEVRYVANAGMLVRVGGRRILIDAPIRDGIPPYATSAADERSRLESARPPYDEVDGILITHWHEDHFSPEAIASHLAHNPRAVFVSSPEVAERLRRVSPDLPAGRVRAVLPARGHAERVVVGGVPVHVLGLRHNPSRRDPEQHVGFLIGDTATVLHVGDADPTTENFSLMARLPRVDLALVPFWYVTETANRALVADVIKPARVVAMHVPPADVEQVTATVSRAAFGAVVAAVPGSALALER